jgi:hypothetical protein
LRGWGMKRRGPGLVLVLVLEMVLEKKRVSTGP